MADLSGVACDISIVIPAFNEQESIPELLARIHEVLTEMGRTYEVLVIDDGSSDGTFDKVVELAAGRPEIHGISFSRNYGKAAALAAGFTAAGGRLVITMDADLQDDPVEIPRLVAKIEDEGYDLVSGWKQNRQDSFIKNQTSKLFNGVTSLMSGLRLHDFNCGLKAYRSEVIKTLRLYGEMHRYTPALAHLEGFRVGELKVRHHARRFGVTKYGPARFLNGFLDLLTVLFLNSRSTSPLHFFGRIGLFFLLAGSIIDGYFLVQWIAGHGLHIRPLLLLGVTLILLAVQFVSLGLMAELIVAGRHPEMEYRVRRRI
ncbi:MAG: glycosyltransferase family 2 protein [bacterium]